MTTEAVFKVMHFEVVTSQEMQMASGSWKEQETDSSLELPEEHRPADTLIFTC